MPRVSFTEEHKVQKSNYDFPRLKLETGEKARIAIVEEPVVEYRHSLDAPRVANGRVETREVDGRNGKYTDYVRDFISSPLCTGDPDTLSENGVDPDKCLMCAYSLEHSDRVKAPQRRYAMHVIRYKTKPGSSSLSTPFSVELIVWAFPDGTFNKIIEFNQEWAESGGLKGHDLIITCKAAKFQNYEFSVSPDAAWQKDDETKETVKQTFEHNQIPDLSIACGSRKQETWIKNDLDKVDEAWELVNRIQSEENEESSDDFGGSASLGADFDSMLNSGSSSKEEDSEESSDDSEPKEEKKASGSDQTFSDLFG